MFSVVSGAAVSITADLREGDVMISIFRELLKCSVLESRPLWY
jgi:hypothetical protein